MTSNLREKEKTFEMFDAYVEEIEEKNDFQIIINNRRNYMWVGKLFEEKIPHPHHTSFATHCIDFTLKDIGKITSINKGELILLALFIVVVICWVC